MPKDPCVLHLRDGNARSPTSFEITVLIEDITKPGSGCLATSHPTNGLVSAHLRLSASHSMSQPAHLTSWPITTFEIYKENAGMSNLGLGKETSPASFLNSLPCGSQTGVIFFFFDSQGKPDRDHVSESSSPIQHQSCGILIASLSPSPGNILLCDH